MQPAAQSPPHRRPVATALGGLVIVSLLLNVSLAAWLWRVQSSQDDRLARLESAGLSVKSAPGRTDAAGRPHEATRQERVAFLLAAAGDPDASKQILAAVPPDEDAEIARALVARPAANDRNEALDAALRYLAGSDAPRAITILASLEESGLKTRLAHRVVVVWAATNPEAAARWLVDGGQQFFDPRQTSTELAAAVARWSAFAPEAAARFIDDRPPDGGTQPTPNALALGQACLEWGRRDASAALAWVQSLPTTDPRQPYALDGVIRAWTEQDPVSAAGFVRQGLLASPAAGGAAIAVAVVQTWTAKDPEAAARWASGLPDPAVRQAATREAAARWAQSDPANAERWATGLPPDRTRGSVWIGLTEHWADTDSARAEAWLGRLPAGRDRDEATTVYINRLTPMDPGKALTWARTLTGPAFAAEQVRNVLAQWEIKDAAAARNWAAANGVSLPPVVGGR